MSFIVPETNAQHYKCNEYDQMKCLGKEVERRKEKKKTHGKREIMVLTKTNNGCEVFDV